MNEILKLYFDLNKTLVSTLVIKMTRNITSINDYVTASGGVVHPFLPKTWKWYLNVSGEYHDTDEIMKIVSLDTGEIIIFNKETLVEHPATAEAYIYRSRYYYRLLAEYPRQEQLILGILNPADIDTAIEAEEGSIVSYSRDLVEEQEITLIYELEQYIKSYLTRWDVQAFGKTHTLYNTAQYAVMILNILPKLINLRLKRCKTNEVHSFHIRMFLASHGRLDRYMPYLTLKQALWLYRNLCFLEKRNGQTEQFKKLISHLLTERFIPLTDISVRQLHQFDDSYFPLLTARRKPLNTQYNSPEKEYFNIDVLLNKERKIAEGNSSYLDNHSPGIVHSLTTASSAVIQTKDLESSMIDYSDAMPDTLFSVLMRQWCYMSTHGLYDALINFRNPVDSQVYTLNAADAFIYMWYIQLKSIGIEIDHLPPYVNIKYRPQRIATKVELLSVIDKKCSNRFKYVTDILSTQPVMKHCSSVKSFYTVSQLVWEEMYRQWYLISNVGDLEERGMVQATTLKLYEDAVVQLPTGNVTMGTWLEQRSLPIYNFSLDQANKCIFNIFISAVGVDMIPAKMMKNIQKAMISILSQLSSYSIQYIREINDSAITVINWPSVRPGNLKVDSDSEQLVPLDLYIHGVHGNLKEDVIIDLDLGYPDKPVKGQTKHDVSVIIKSTTEIGSHGWLFIELPLTSLKIECSYPGYLPTTNFIGEEYFMALTAEQQSQIKSIY